jgi:hypothetical protein
MHKSILEMALLKIATKDNKPDQPDSQEDKQQQTIDQTQNEAAETAPEQKDENKSEPSFGDKFASTLEDWWNKGSKWAKENPGWTAAGIATGLFALTDPLNLRGNNHAPAPGYGGSGGGGVNLGNIMWPLIAGGATYAGLKYGPQLINGIKQLNAFGTDYAAWRKAMPTNADGTIDTSVLQNLQKLNAIIKNLEEFMESAKPRNWFR